MMTAAMMTAAMMTAAMMTAAMSAGHCVRWHRERCRHCGDKSEFPYH
jgi:hypothetical protein